MSEFKEVKFDSEGESFYFVAADSSGRKEGQPNSRVIVLGVGAKNQPDEKKALEVAELLLPPSQIKTMDQVDLRMLAMTELFKFKDQKIEYKWMEKLRHTFSGFKQTKYWQEFNSFFELMIDNWNESGWERIVNEYKIKLDQAREDEYERKTQEKREEIINTGMGNVRLPGELEERYQGKQGELLLKYLFLEQSISERDYHNRGKFGPHSVANHPLDYQVFPDNELARKNNEKFYELLAGFSGRSSFTREDFAREIVAIYPWLEENISKKDLDSKGRGYQMGELVRRIQKEFKL